VYRTYVRHGQRATPTDVRVVEAAVLSAAIRHPDIEDDLLGFLRDLLLLRVPGEDEEGLALRFQQLSGPVMAKAVEDTAFYRWVPVTWRNEVGGDPGRTPIGLDAFHSWCATAHQDRPAALLATSTHDTKRSEDVRARLSVLAEDPAGWASAVTRWRERNAEVRQAPPPDRSTEWLLYQTLVGAWPIDAERLKAYMAKATHEAKVHTSWTDPDVYYDEALAAYIDELLADDSFVADVEAFVDGLRRPGWAAALTMKLVTLTAPGVPDLYQGSEVWDLSLVDPDNRRPVDYGHRRALLASVVQPSTGGAATRWAAESGDGATKLAVVHAALTVRAERPAVFGPGREGRYEPLAGAGPAAPHLLGFVRGGEVATLATRAWSVLACDGGWRDTTVTLPDGRWTDRLSGSGSAPGPVWDGGSPLPLAEVLAAMPVALLVREAAQ
jgi:(1->4)-alpha-D-glucan 1-alpha-D-glucosylmutase